jgi:hypothetical protein
LYTPSAIIDWEEGGYMYAFGGKPEGKNYVEKLSVDGRIVLRLILIKRDEVLDWGDTARDGKMYMTLVNTVMNVCVS